MSESLRNRLIVGLVGLAILLPGVIFFDPWVTDIFVTLALIVAVEEYTRMAVPENVRLGYAVFGGGAALVHFTGMLWPEMLPGALGVAAMAALVAGLLGIPDTNKGVRASAWMVCGLVYLPVLFGMLSAVRRLDNGVTWVFVALALAWAADTGAYFAGRAFGKTPLFARVSPKKTVEGAIGGAVAVVAVIALVKVTVLQRDSVEDVLNPPEIRRGTAAHHAHDVPTQVDELLCEKAAVLAGDSGNKSSRHKRSRRLRQPDRFTPACRQPANRPRGRRREVPRLPSPPSRCRSGDCRTAYHRHRGTRKG